jgi:hypothetical protein
MSQYGSTRFGWDAPSRIAGTTQMLMTAEATLPGETMIQPLIPFYPTSTPATSVIEGSTGNVPAWVEEDGRQIWQAYPAFCDLVLWQGDDVIITMYFRDSENPSLDMSDEAGFTWSGEIKTSRDYNSTLVAQLTCVATYVPATVDVAASTKVEMFFPRQSNLYAGCFAWELKSVSTADLSRFPKPDAITIWPPTTFLRSWLFGGCYILARTGETDYLIDTVPDPIPAVGGYSMVPFVGPNGRVP